MRLAQNLTVEVESKYMDDVIAMRDKQKEKIVSKQRQLKAHIQFQKDNQVNSSNSFVGEEDSELSQASAVSKDLVVDDSSFELSMHSESKEEGPPLIEVKLDESIKVETHKATNSIDVVLEQKETITVKNEPVKPQDLQPVEPSSSPKRQNEEQDDDNQPKSQYPAKLLKRGSDQNASYSTLTDSNGITAQKMRDLKAAFIKRKNLI